MKQIVALIFLSAASAALAADLSPAARRWWSHVQFLADDRLEGRETGSPGHREAALYVARQIAQAGLKPGGSKGYLQPVRFDVRRIDEDNSKLELIRDGKAEPVQFGKEAILGLRIDPAPLVEGPLVFAASALVIPEKGINDLAGLDLKGKIIVTIARVPQGLTTEEMAFYGLRTSKALKEAGVIGRITIPSPKRSDIPWPRLARSRTLSSMSLTDLPPEDGSSLGTSITFNPEAAERLFAGSGQTAAELIALADQGRDLPRFPLKTAIRVKQSVVREQVESQNVIGVVPGADPKLKDEFVVFSAHLDHIGKSRVIEGDGIHNGAMDNASGIASLIEIARQFAENSIQPRRSLAFVAVTGEEKGLLGSRYFVKRPTITGRMVANLNMDMFLPIHPLKVLTVLGLKESDLGPLMAESAAKFGVTVQPDPQPERSAYTRSDQFNFTKIGVPSINAKFGFEPDSTEQMIQKNWLTERYHAPSDDCAQPVDQEAAVLFNRILFDFAVKVANRDARPQWAASSVFRKFEAQPQ